MQLIGKHAWKFLIGVRLQTSLSIRFRQVMKSKGDLSQFRCWKLICMYVASISLIWSNGWSYMDFTVASSLVSSSTDLLSSSTQCSQGFRSTYGSVSREGWEDITTYLQTYPPTYLHTYLPIYLPPLEPPDTHQEPPDNRQEPGDFYFWHTMSDPRDLWLLRHLIRVMRRHDLTKKICLPTYLPTYLHTCLPTYVPPLENSLKEQS